MPLILGTNSIKDTGYDVANSLRFNDGSSDYLVRSLGSQSSLRIGTFSFWIKLSQITVNRQIYSNEVENDNNRGYIQLTNTDELRIVDNDNSGTHIQLKTNRKLRDVSAWYHIVIRIDTTQSTSTDRVRVYINGVQETSFAQTDYPSQNDDLKIFEGGQTNKNLLGSGYPAGSSYIDGYICEFVYCDGQSLDPTSFGEFDSDTNIWKPIDVTGLTFGNNGFYLDFEDSSALGKDVSGNNNNFTVNNLTALDQSTDTCTNNYATINALNMTLPTGTLSQGNLSHSGITATNYASPLSTIGVSQGKWYVEFKITDVNNWIAVGITGHVPNATGDYLGQDADSWGYIGGSSAGGSNSLYHSGSGSTYGATYANNDIIGVYLDLDNNKLYFAKNGSIQNSGTGISIDDPSTITGGFYFIGAGGFSGSYTHGYQVNYGAGCPFTISSGNADANGYGNFEYDPSDGGSSSFDSSAKDFYALNTKNLAEFG